MAIDDQAIQQIQKTCPECGYFLAFSGGKDSAVLFDLVMRSGVTYDAHYNVVGADPPELVRHIKTCYSSVAFDIPPRSLWSMIVPNGLPLMHRRWCCRATKERGGRGRTVLTGIRSEESVRRKGREMVEVDRNDSTKLFIHPILHWTEKDIWEYIDRRGLPYCALYDEEPINRLGCILCPSNSAKATQYQMGRWPKIAALWERAAIRSWERQTPGMQKWDSGQDYFDWWLTRK